jgi:hypothetical protein
MEFLDQDKEQWQIFVNEVRDLANFFPPSMGLISAKLWGSKLKYIMENYEEQWPMMVYMHKHLAYTSRRRRRKRMKAEKAERRDSNVEIPASVTVDMFKNEMPDDDAIDGSSSLVSSISKPIILCDINPAL